MNKGVSTLNIVIGTVIASGLMLALTLGIIVGVAALIFAEPIIQIIKFRRNNNRILCI